MSSRAADDAVAAYQEARVNGLKAALTILALMTVLALFLAQSIPNVQPGREQRARDELEPEPGVVSASVI